MTYDFTEKANAFVTANANRAVFDDLSADAIESMSMAEFASRTGRKMNIRPATVQPDTISRAVSAPESQPEQHQGVSIEDMTLAEYAEFRQQVGIGRGEYGRGILSQGGESWAEAAARKSGRSAMNERNVTPAARVDAEKYLQQNLPVQGRTTFYAGA